MPRQKQIEIIKIVSDILDCEPQKENFHWLNNIPIKKYFGAYYNHIISIYRELGGNEETLEIIREESKARKLSPDAFYPYPFEFIFEFDEIQHFTSYKKNALIMYPEKLKYGFDLKQYIGFCNKYASEALRKGPGGYRRPTKEFDFINGRAAQRAFFDAFRDIQPTLFKLNPTIRISELELQYPFERLKVKKLLKDKFRLAGVTF